MSQEQQYTDYTGLWSSPGFNRQPEAVVVSDLVPVRFAWRVRGTLHRPNLTETATLVTGRYVSQQCQCALVYLESHAPHVRCDIQDLL
jgi:hypothetical protein